MKALRKRLFPGTDPVHDYAQHQLAALQALFGDRVAELLQTRFQCQRRKPKFPEAADDPYLSSLSALGFADLGMANFYLDHPSLTRMKTEGQLKRPALCSICGTAAQGERDSAAVRIDNAGEHREISVGMPYCGEHVQTAQGAPLLGLAWRGDYFCVATAIGSSQAFLAELAHANADGPITPPWLAYPKELPEWGGWRQGNAEYWYHRVWWPYWAVLPESARADYLAHWQAPPAWRERLARGEIL